MRRLLSPTLVLTALLCCAAILSPVAATAATSTGTLTGTVVAPGLPKGDRVKVTLYSLQCQQEALLATAAGWSCNGDSVWATAGSPVIVDANGRYRFAGLDPSTFYRVVFIDTAGRYAEQWLGVNAYDDQYAVNARVAAGRATMVPTTTLSRGGAISGRISSTMIPFAHFSVQVMRYSAGAGWLAWSDDRADSFMTSNEGSFTVSHLPPGRYRISVGDANDLGTWYPSSATASGSTAVTVTAGHRTRLAHRLTMLAGATISGTVTAAGLTDLSDVSAVLQRWSAADGSWVDVSSTVSRAVAADGSYSIGPIPAGRYRLGFALATYATTFYPAAATPDGATTLSLKNGGAATGINVTLTEKL